MTPMGLEDEEIRDVMNYILNSFGNDYAKMIRLKDVTRISKDSVPLGGLTLF